MHKKYRRYLLLIAFAVFIWGFSLLDMISPTQEFSELENRPLAQAPDLRAKTLINNTYTLQYEEFVNDQFAGRDAWITVKSLSETALAKTENNGIAYGKDGQLIEIVSTLDTRQLERNLGFIRAFAEQYADQSITLTIIPNSYAILDDKLPAGLPLIDQLAMIEESYASLADTNLKMLDIVPVLQGCKGEYIYYRTDHHWTTLGASYAADAYLQSVGKPPLQLEALEPDRREEPGFYGTYYSKAKNWDAVPDTIDWYDWHDVNVEVDGIVVKGLYDYEMFDKRDKYAAFLNGNNGLTVITGDGAGDKDASKLLVFKDSYGNCLVPLLTRSFDEIHVVDLRYFSEVSELMSSNTYDEIYVLYNFSTLSQDVNVYKMGLEG